MDGYAIGRQSLSVVMQGAKLATFEGGRGLLQRASQDHRWSGSLEKINHLICSQFFSARADNLGDF
jgi:hypothetical protein